MIKAIFLDRDGTINKDHGFVHRSDQFEFIDGVPQAICKLHKYFKIFVVTNQSGVGTGKYTLLDMHLVHEHMLRQLYLHGAIVEDVAYCPHAPDLKCGCRKPEVGMLVQLEQKHGLVDYNQSWMVGDKISDIMMGHRAGMKTALIESQYWESPLRADRSIMVVDSLRDFTDRIINDA